MSEVSKVDQETFLITSNELAIDALQSAIKNYKDNYKDKEMFSTYFNENTSIGNADIDSIEKLALGAQSDLNKIIKINNIVRYYVNKNDILGMVYSAIESNVNADYTLSYPNYNEQDKEIYKKVDEIINEFNESINLEQLIVDSIPMAYLEGNYPIYLKKDQNQYQVDYYPLGIIEVSDYTVNGDPYLLLNIAELKNRLQKIYQKNRKNSPLFFTDMDEEIRKAYPKEVYEGYKNNEKYAKLDINNSGIIRTNNFKRKYGLSPIYKALIPVIRLENIELSDDKNTLVRGKKIIFQKLSKELFLEEKKNPNLDWFSAQAKAHQDLMKSLKMQSVSVYTGPPWVESIEYIEPKIEPTNVNIKNQYRENIMTSVGISFLINNKGGFGTAQISITELMKTIDKICKQLERILEKWYKGILKDNNIDPKYYPKIKVIDSEKMSTELSISLAKLLHNELNASLETVYKTIGLDLKTEARKRVEEKENGYDIIFSPRMTAYTNNQTDDQGGRPSEGRNPDKTIYDKEENLENGE